MSTTTNPNTNGTLVDTEMEASARIASVVVAVRPETRTDNTTENSENSMDFTTAPIPPDIHAEGYQTKMNAQNTNECQNESVDTKVSSVLDTVVAGADTSEQGQSAAAAVAPPLQQDQLPSDIASSKLEYPRPNDILMPVGGYQLWSGNAHYQELIETHRPEFLLLLKEVDDRDNGNNNERKQSIVRKIFQTIDKVQSGRFLMAVPVAAETLPLSGTGTSGSGGKIVRTMVWNVMKEEDVLAQVEQSLTTRSEEEARRHAKLERKRRRKEKRRKRRERRRQRRRDRKTVEASWERPISPSAMGALQSLYYVPPHYPLKDGKKRSGLECDSESLSSSSSSSSSSDEETIVRPAKKKKKVARKASKLPTLAPASTSLVLEQKESSTEPTSAKKEVNFHYKPKTKKSLQAVIDTEGEATLPKGVTVRPSGKWVRFILSTFFFLPGLH